MIQVTVQPTDPTWLGFLSADELDKYNEDRTYTLDILEVSERSLKFKINFSNPFAISR